MSKLPTLPRKKDSESMGTQSQPLIQVFSFSKKIYSLWLLILAATIVFSTRKTSVSVSVS